MELTIIIAGVVFLTGIISAFFISRGFRKGREASEIDTMNGHDFDYFCADLLKKRGFIDVTVTKGSGDYGIDVLAEKGYRFVTVDELLNRNTGNGWKLDPARIYCTMKDGDYSKLIKSSWS